ncbi:hypothetical protein F3Y22_tig00111027pilonHSYRG00092 [Hibiscus syriacus]|uniref:LIM zinc-binding domain-containing protein n=1 Tax=Hibiscus syriacus TaxID=106335 RepID=A0A6A2Z4F1_HIBSY|nr:hypothetical protein F3Y22_tig00111027pilonHSYRG00092 [Hibiscus syriacus]
MPPLKGYSQGLILINSSKELAVWIRVLKNALKVLNLFDGTREKCKGCSKTAYPIEGVAAYGTLYHKSCFKCTHGGQGNYSQLEMTDRKKQQNATADKVASIEVATGS